MDTDFCREVLERASPLALLNAGGLAIGKRQKAAAVQDADAQTEVLFICVHPCLSVVKISFQ
jgi:hypothetical protein